MLTNEVDTYKSTRLGVEIRPKIQGPFRALIDPGHQVHCTAISKCLKFYVRLVTQVTPYTVQGKSVPIPPKLGNILRHKHWSDRNSSVHLLLINNLVCCRFEQLEQQSDLPLEWICRYAKFNSLDMRGSFVWPGSHPRLEASLGPWY